MLVSGALSLPPKGRRVRQLPAVPRESGALFRKNERFSREGSKKRTKCVCIPRLFSVKLQKIYEKSATVSVFPLVLLFVDYEKVQQSRVRARFCCSEIRKSATVSCSRSLLLFGITKKCNSLVFPLAFAVRNYEKVQQSRVPARFCCS